MANSSTKAKNKYNALNYDSLRVTVPKGKKAEYQAHAKTCGYPSFNAFVNSAILNQIESDKKANKGK